MLTISPYLASSFSASSIKYSLLPILDPRPMKIIIIFLAMQELISGLASGNDARRDFCRKELIDKHLKHDCRPSEVHTIARLWKGLFYTIWLADGVVNCRKMSVEVAMIFRLFRADDYDSMSLYLALFLVVLHQEWDFLDKYRVEKFNTMIRLVVAEILLVLRKQGFALKSVVGLLGPWFILSSGMKLRPGETHNVPSWYSEVLVYKKTRPNPGVFIKFAQVLFDEIEAQLGSGNLSICGRSVKKAKKYKATVGSATIIPMESIEFLLSGFMKVGGCFPWF